MNLQIMSEKYCIFTIINIIIFVFGLNKEKISLLLGIAFVLSFAFSPSKPIFFPNFPVNNKTPSQANQIKSVFMLILGNFCNNYLTFQGLPNQV